ncbi:hypothetical protein GCM10011378_07800 [Hymenobacter glacieicola]|uniref:Uncharacterized protein n=1 Tax=Hymenobacter glacieicola TaxID=1562124 RepID=A0ABQ1WM51_9BACT|nr:hypothetical protein GCM10011378_07800 [Hymenobacter glacieicola]
MGAAGAGGDAPGWAAVDFPMGLGVWQAISCTSPSAKPADKKEYFMNKQLRESTRPTGAKALGAGATKKSAASRA